MADKSLLDKARDAVNSSPTVQRVVEAGREFVTDPTNVRGAAGAWKNRKKTKAKQGRSGSGRQ